MAEKIKIKLKLTEVQAGYLLSAVMEFHHNLHSAMDNGTPANDIAERVEDAKVIWKQIESQAGVE